MSRISARADRYYHPEQEGRTTVDVIRTQRWIHDWEDVMIVAKIPREVYVILGALKWEQRMNGFEGILKS
jgi:hypothetical protein